MRGHDSYAVLGLRPGAGRAEVDQAYRRLIKRHHPDHEGGDAGRAAELNRAYSELRARTREPNRPQRPRPAGPGAMPRQLRGRPRSRWRSRLLGLSMVAAAVLVARSAAMDTKVSWPQFPSGGGAAAADSKYLARAAPPMSMDQPLSAGLIDRAVADAMRMHAAEDPLLAAEFSRECISRLGVSPSVPLFDSCAAYDEAIAILAVDNPAFESGPFNPSAVTARQVGAARLLSADYLESESRLQQIRARVHMQLLPRLPDAVVSTEGLLVGSPAH